ncbi:MAG: AAA family ATPase [Microbacterium sp.]|nr:AAA family ATPase [Microbacterium sp.]
MALRFRFTSMTSSAGHEVPLPNVGLTCIVGPNNAGKSQLLRELRSVTAETSSAGHGVVLKDVQAERPTGSEEDATLWLSEHAIKFDTPPGEPPAYGMNYSAGSTTAKEFAFWTEDRDYSDSPAYLGNVSEFFLEYVAAGSPREFVSGHVGDSGPNHALARMRSSGTLEESVSDVIQSAFGVGITVDRLDIQTTLRVGDVGVEVPPLNRPSSEYQRALASLPLIDSQGDGFRSFVGLASHFLTHDYEVWLIDEPEAFLHPGQTRILGRWLATEAVSRGVQLIVATHDRDFIVGALSAAQSEVSIVRLTRHQSGTRFDHLSSDDVADVWSKPQLRYSNVLQGLFHAKVVVCEGDGDCRFYSAALESLSGVLQKPSLADDVLFVPSAGKGGLSHMVDAVAKVGVETWVIADFDLLKSKTEVQKVVSSVGGEWSSALNEAYATAIREPNANREWERFKRTGLHFFLAPDSLAAARQLIQSLAALRVLLVPVGELESFDRTLGADKNAWIGKALETRLHESDAVRGFVSPILESGNELSADGRTSR